MISWKRIELPCGGKVEAVDTWIVTWQTFDKKDANYVWGHGEFPTHKKEVFLSEDSAKEYSEALQKCMDFLQFDYSKPTITKGKSQL